jgi:alkylhydroperoxidase family enzyme
MRIAGQSWWSSALYATGLFVALAMPAAALEDSARVSLLDDAAAWPRLPLEGPDLGKPLPHWARALAESLPRTTAAMLQLDYVQRARSPLDPKLRAAMRWVAADANRSPYGRATAEADLRRAGATEAEIQALAKGEIQDRPAPERKALAFARALTLEADKVTDAEVAALMSHYGDSNVVAMVLLLAYANFQDRLLLTLGIEVEPGGPLPPLEVRFIRDAKPPEIPARTPPPPEDVAALPPVPTHVDDPEWTSLDFGDLQDRLEGQRSGPGRIRVPTYEEVLSKLPPEYPKPKSPVRIQWSLVTMGYQTELAIAWSACTRTFGEEAKQDRVFEESLFWVVTRTIHCFY